MIGMYQEVAGDAATFERLRWGHLMLSSSSMISWVAGTRIRVSEEDDRDR